MWTDITSPYALAVHSPHSDRISELILMAPFRRSVGCGVSARIVR